MADNTKNQIEYLYDQIKGVSVVIPCKNEEKAVRMTVEDIRAALNDVDIDYEIIVVDDGSTDNTRQEAYDSGARVLVHNINMGYGNSIMDGIRIAEYPLIAIIDADGTYPASMLPDMIREASCHDMIIGTRVWTEENTSLMGKIMRKALYYVIMYFSNVKAPDYNSGFRVFHKLNILDYRSILCPTFSFTTSLTLLYLLMSRSIHSIPIEYSKRIGSSKVSYIRDAIRTFSYVFILTNLFQAYRLSLLIILFGVVLNLIVIIITLTLGLMQSVQLGLHIIVSLAIVIGIIAMNTYPTAQMYLHHLHERERNE